MLFNSYPFIFVLLPVALAGFFLAQQFSRRLALMWLTFASLAFYSYWDVRYLGLVITSIVVNCGIGYLIGAHRSRAWLIVGVGVNVTVLVWFKYALFFYLVVTNGSNPPAFLTGIVLPLGVSFFTFQQIAYLVQVWRGHEKPASLETHAFIVLFFPHLIAGPIVLYENILRQVKGRPHFMGYLGKSFKIGVLFFAVGLFKKVVVADSLAPFANDIFSFAARPDYEISCNDAWLGALAYSLQLYFDFSGYSDMAIGLGRMFGFHRPLNFNSPYKAGSIIDFWHRWHITLSSFFRTYVYSPLGGNRHGLVRQIACIAVVFFLTGLWHGAAWSFVVWGLAHGALVIINNLWNKVTADFLRVITVQFPSFRKLYDFFAWCLTIFFVTLLWVLFRAESLEVALKIMDAMLHPWRSAGRVVPDSNVYYPLWIALIGLNLWCWIAPNTKELIYCCRPSAFVQTRFIAVKGICLNFQPWVYACFVGVALYSALTSIGYVRSQFIYFNF